MVCIFSRECQLVEFVPEGVGTRKFKMSSSSHMQQGDNSQDEETETRKRFKPAKIGARLAPQLEHQLDSFWKSQLDEQLAIHSSGPLKPDFKTVADLPLSRVKRVMKADGDVRMVSAEAPVVFARACSMFILDLTLRSWFEATGKDRKTVQREDVHDAILKADVYDFLVDIVNGILEQEKEEMRRRRQLGGGVDAESHQLSPQLASHQETSYPQLTGLQLANGPAEFPLSLPKAEDKNPSLKF